MYNKSSIGLVGKLIGNKASCSFIYQLVLMPLLWLSLAFIGGIYLSDWMQLNGISWLIVSGICFSLGIFVAWGRSNLQNSFRKVIPVDKLPHLAIVFLPCLFALGAARYQFSQPELSSPGFITTHNDSGLEVKVVGMVTKSPDIRDDRVVIRLASEGIQTPGRQEFVPVEGILQVTIWENISWHYGDRIMVQGELETPPEFEDFSYRDYLARQGVYSYMNNAQVTRVSSPGGNPLLRLIYAFRQYALETAYRLWPDPEASLLAGILLGIESGIPENVDQAFRDTGTSHIIVISGFNITIIVGLLIGVFSRLFGGGQIGVRRGAVVAIVGIVLYTILVGGDAAVVRAAIMGVTALFASLVGRRQDGLLTLAIVAALMAAFNPNILWDVSFRLSFAATLGLVLYAGPLKDAFERFASGYVTVERAQKWSGPVGEYLLYTFAAQLLVLPLIIYYFNRFSISSIIANPLILPFQPPLMILGGLALMAGTIYLPLGQVLAWITWPFAAYTIRMVELLAKFQGGVISLGEVSGVIVVSIYAVLFGLTFTGSRSDRVNQWFKPGIVLAGLVVIAILVWRILLAAPDGRLHMTLLNVGSGDAILVQTPSGRNLLIGGGPSTRQLSDSLGRRLPYGGRRIDWLVVAATAEGQLAGLPRNIERFPPTNVLWAGPQQGSRPAGELLEKLTEEEIGIIQAEGGQVLDLGRGAKLNILEVNQRGAVLLLEWDNFRALLPIGLDFDSLANLGSDADLREITVLLLAESGYAPLNTSAWIEQLHPRLVLLSVAAGDAEGLPSPETLLAVKGYQLLRTDQNGWIKLSTDGEQLWVEVEKK
jgi:competence protein ComEC